MSFRPALVLLPCLLALGCDSHDDDHASTGPCADGTYLLAGEMNDEACIAFVDAEGRGQIATDPTKAPTFTAPGAPGAPVKVSKGVPPRFAWTAGTLALTPWKRFLRAIDPISTAWAHGDVTGDAAVLIFRDSAKKEVYRVLTSGTEFTPDLATWQRVGASGSLEVTLVGVRFTANVIATGTRPTAGNALSLTVE